MSKLVVSKKGAIDFLSLGALVCRLDPGIIPFHKATTFQAHRYRDGNGEISSRPFDTGTCQGYGRKTVL